MITEDTYFAWLLEKHRPFGLLIDANVLLLWLVGEMEQNQIRRHPRTRMFEPADYDLLKEIVSHFSKLLVTPHILTEAVNLGMQGGEGFAARFLHLVAIVTGGLDEHFSSAIELTSSETFLRLGLTDASIHNTARAGCLVLTADARLVSELESLGLGVLNFNHLRSSRFKLP